MLLVLDTNEYLFTFGLLQKESCKKLIDALSEKYLSHKLRIPRLIVEEVRRNLTDESFKEFILFINTFTKMTKISAFLLNSGPNMKQKDLNLQMHLFVHTQSGLVQIP